MQTNLHQIRIAQITSPLQSGLGPKALQTTQNWHLWPKVQHFRMILSLPFASNPWIFGGFESPVQLKGVCSIFVALDSSARKEEQCCQQGSEEEALDGREQSESSPPATKHRQK